MFLVRLVYASKVATSFGPDDIEQILSTARRENSKRHVTGMLCFNRKYFLQCLEGSRHAVNETYHRILNDPRHKDILILEYQEIDEREFSEWSMGYMPESSLTEPLNLKYSGTPAFDPFEMSGEAAHNMMLALKESVPSV